MDIQDVLDVERLGGLGPEVRAPIMTTPNLLQRLPEDRRPAAIARVRDGVGVLIRLHGEADAIRRDPLLSDRGRAARLTALKTQLDREVERVRQQGGPIHSALERLTAEARQEPLPPVTSEGEIRAGEIRRYLASLSPVDREAQVRAAYQRADWESVGAVLRAPRALPEIVPAAVLARARAERLAASPVAPELEMLRTEQALVETVVGALEAFSSALTGAPGGTSPESV